MVLKKIKKFIELSSEQKKLFIEAWLTLGMTRTISKTTSFKSQARDFNPKENGNIRPLSEHQKNIAIMVGESIASASGYTPWDSACLIQSFTAQQMLKKRGIPGVVFIGVRKDDSGEDTLKAHAWSQCGDRIITGHLGHDEFNVISVLEWG
ncbi:lasso peptide biosynthesis B2 protein [Thermodesulfobacteriota bacterium]